MSLALLALAIKRLASRPGLTLLLILSATLTIGLVTCVPVFVDAISLQILQEEIARKMAAQHSPPFPVTVRAVPEYGQVMTMEEAVYDQAWIADRLSRAIGLPIRSSYIQNDGSPFFLIAPEGDPRYKEDARLPGAGDGGARSGDAHQDRGGRPLWRHLATPPTSMCGSIAPGPRNWACRWGTNSPWRYRWRGAYRRCPVQIVGIWEPIDPDDRSFWPDHPAKLLEQRLLTTEAQYLTFVYPVRPERTYAHLWYFVLDDRQMSFQPGGALCGGLGGGGPRAGGTRARRQDRLFPAGRAAERAQAPGHPVGDPVQL